MVKTFFKSGVVKAETVPSSTIGSRRYEAAVLYYADVVKRDIRDAVLEILDNSGVGGYLKTGGSAYLRELGKELDAMMAFDLGTDLNKNCITIQVYRDHSSKWMIGISSITVLGGNKSFSMELNPNLTDEKMYELSQLLITNFQTVINQSRNTFK